jgi:hypothetical protein
MKVGDCIVRHSLIAASITALLISTPAVAQDNQGESVAQQQAKDANAIAQQQAEDAMNTVSGGAGRDEPGAHTNREKSSVPASVSLTKDQSHALAESVKKSGAPVANIKMPDVASTLPLPLTVDLYDLPPGVNIPSLQGLKYLRLSDRILLVQPGTRRVVGAVLM